MSKVIIDGNLIDLEMITHISLPIDYLDESYFTIHFIGKKTVQIYRFYGTIWRTPLIDSMDERMKTMIKEAISKRDHAVAAIHKMHDELVKRWSPSMLQFDDLTVE